MHSLATIDDWNTALDRTVAELLESARIVEPPVDAIDVALRLGMEVILDQSQQPRGRHARLAGLPALFVRPEERPERLQWSVAHELGEELAYRVVERLATPRDELAPQEREEIANRLASRLLLPGCWFLPQASACGGDLFQLKQAFATASHELIAWRLLDLPEPAMITLFDQGKLIRRRGNAPNRPPRLQEIERWCWRQVHEFGEPCRSQHGGLTVQGWPVHEPGWKREFLRTTSTGEADDDSWCGGDE